MQESRSISDHKFIAGLQKPFCIVDIKSTGPDPEKDRIIELCLLKLLPGGKFDELESRFNPNISIPYSSYKKHGIKDSDLTDAPTFSEKAVEIASFISGCDFGGANTPFDLALIEVELNRAKVNFSYINSKQIDILGIWLNKEKRNLQKACEYFLNEKPEENQSARKDARVTLKVLLSQIDKYDLTNDIEELNNLSYRNGNIFTEAYKNLKVRMSQFESNVRKTEINSLMNSLFEQTASEASIYEQLKDRGFNVEFEDNNFIVKNQSVSVTFSRNLITGKKIGQSENLSFTKEM